MITNIKESIIEFFNNHATEIFESLLISSIISVIFLHNKNLVIKLSTLLVNSLLIFKVLYTFKSKSPEILKYVKHGAGIGVGLTLMAGGNPANDKTESADECSCKKPSASNISNVSNKQTSTSTSTSTPVSPYRPGIFGLARGPIKAETKINAQEEQANRLLLCESLVKNGFNTTWTDNDIKNLKTTVAGRRKLMGLNRRVLEDTNLTELTNAQIISCFPEYMSVSPCLSKAESTEKLIEEEIMQEQAEALQEKNKLPCILSSFYNDLKQSVANHYAQKNLPSPIPNRKLQEIITYVTNRAESEIQNLINKYQSVPYYTYKNDMKVLKAGQPQGISISGTSYHIPWDLLDVYNGCFGM